MVTQMLLQLLESRRMFSTAPHAELIEGMLFIRGTNGNDHVMLQEVTTGGATRPARVNVVITDEDWLAQGVITRSASTTVTRDKIRSIHFEGLRGNDWFIPSLAQHLGGLGLVPVWSWGGPGDDYLDGGHGNDRLRGEGGDDEIFGQGGNDTIMGGAGNDFLNGVGGRDRVYGHDGDDFLLEDDSFNTLDGGNGNDVIEVTSGESRNKNLIDGGDGYDRTIAESMPTNASDIEELIPPNTPYTPPARH
jgi:Ca2+-binding RTX toxin-like protein